MKTEQWIDLLAADAEAVNPRAPDWRLAAVMLAGAAAAIGIAVQSWGWRSFDAPSLGTAMLWVRWGFCLAVVAVAWQAFNALARPGYPLRGVGAAVAMPFALMALLALAEWSGADPQERWELLMGSTALQCPFNIARTTVPVFIGSLWAMHRMAPIRPAMAGASAGLLSGGIGALGYTFHCTELTAPFVAVWYTLGIALPVGVGALIGSRWLRW
jgi:hypothetical protein